MRRSFGGCLIFIVAILSIPVLTFGQEKPSKPDFMYLGLQEDRDAPVMVDYSKWSRENSNKVDFLLNNESILLTATLYSLSQRRWQAHVEASVAIVENRENKPWLGFYSEKIYALNDGRIVAIFYYLFEHKDGKWVFVKEFIYNKYLDEETAAFLKASYSLVWKKK